MISMGKKANAFFFPGSYFLFPSFFSHDLHRKKTRHCLSLREAQMFGGCSGSKTRAFSPSRRKKQRTLRLVLTFL